MGVTNGPEIASRLGGAKKQRQSLHLTEELVALVERLEPDPGPEPGTSEHNDADYLAMAAAMLAAYRPDELWLFAYGSLIWNPEFEVIEQRPAVATGWHRSFCMTMTRWRGTREQPTLMMALDRGGSCKGIAYRLPKGDHLGQIDRLLKREIDANPPTNIPQWITVTTDQGKQRALTFIADPAGKAYAGRQSVEQVAHVLASAAGHWGSSAQYLYRTVSKLEEHGIRDRNLWRIQQLVAEEIIAARGKKS